MKVAFYLNIISPHQLPLAREVTKCVGTDNFIYVYAEDLHSERANMGWNDRVAGLRVEKLDATNRAILESADVLYTGLRCLELMESRAKRGLKSYYYSERWFKPPFGILRLCHPRYFRMAIQFVKLFRMSGVTYLPVGVHAASDMARLVGLLAGDGRCLFRAPKIKFEQHPFGAISHYPWMKMWGYFVEPGSGKCRELTEHKDVKVLYVGRLLKLKHVDTIIRAVALLNKKASKSTVDLDLISRPRYTLTIVGDGPEKSRLQNLANSFVDLLSPPTFSFQPSVPISEVRSVMRQHDILVFSSNGYDGWGAVVSEALEEGVCVLGSRESGAPSTMLPEEQLFGCTDWRALAVKIKSVCVGQFSQVSIGPWTAKKAAMEMMS